MTPAQQFISNGLTESANVLGGATFTWKGGTYSCIVSISRIEELLDTGGFKYLTMLNMTVPTLNTGFTTTTPQPEDQIVYNENTYIVKLVKPTALNAYLRIEAVSPAEGY